MSVQRTMTYKTHLIMQVPHISSTWSRVTYIDRIACGKNPDNVDSTQTLSEVDCKICRKYIEKRLRING